MPTMDAGQLASNFHSGGLGAAHKDFLSSPAAIRRPLTASHGVAPKIRRRNRLITSCLECRRRKLKCDKQHPCTNCTKFVRDCVFLAPALDPAAQLKLAEIKEKMGSLERTLEDDIARRRNASAAAKPRGGGYFRALDESSEDDDDGPQEEKELEPTSLAFQDAAYHDDADDDLMDLGIKVGKLRITDRLGGFVRPKLAYEMNWIMNEYPDLKDRNGTSGVSPGASVSTGSAIASPEAALKPGVDYIAPSSNFFFAPEPHRTSLMHFLPTKYVADMLLERYWESVHYMCRIVHKPSFLRQYATFWQAISTGVEPQASLQALVLAAMFSAVISVPDENSVLQFGINKQQLVENFQKGTETALCRANFLRTTKLQTLQAFVMYMIPLCRREVSRAHSALAGTAIRLAECMGLHRDGSHFQLSPVEIHVRRMVWHQLCFLDLRTCEATGPRLQIHKDDFDTRYPLNVNDEDLEGPNPPTEDTNYWTDMTFSRMRFEANEWLRFIWFERPRLEKKKTTLTAVLAKVQQFWSATEHKYIPMMDRTKPLHYMAYNTWKLLALRMHVMLLHRYGSNRHRTMPDRLRKILLTSGTQQVEAAILVETAPALRPWAWYCGALHQYHTALALLAELYAAPDRYHEDRIWKCLDYVFELPENLDRRQKARRIISEVAQKSAAYHNLRKVRLPKAVEESVFMQPPKRESVSPTDGATKAPPIAVPQSQQQHQPRPHQRSQSIPVNLTNFIQPNGIPEFRNFAPQVSDVFYAPGTVPTSTPAAVSAISLGETSPQGSDTGSRTLGAQDTGFNGNTSPGDAMLDIDWNEWDKLFPPNVNVDDLHIPDFNFPNEYTAFPQYPRRTR